MTREPVRKHSVSLSKCVDDIDYTLSFHEDPMITLDQLLDHALTCEYHAHEFVRAYEASVIVQNDPRFELCDMFVR